MKYLGRFWNSNEIEVYEIEGRKIALDGWNGEKYYDCFELSDNLVDVISGDKKIVVEPIYEMVDEETESFEITDYEIKEG